MSNTLGDNVILKGCYSQKGWTIQGVQVNGSDMNKKVNIQEPNVFVKWR